MNNLFNALKLSSSKHRPSLITSLLVVTLLYFYLYFYQDILHIEVKFINIYTLLSMPIIYIVHLLIHYVFLSSDPLLTGNSKQAKFFQEELPSKYLLDRCTVCRKLNVECNKPLLPDQHTYTRIWFDKFFDGSIKKSHPDLIQKTYKKGYICRLVFYLSWIFGVAFTINILTILIYNISICYIEKSIKFIISPYQLLYLFSCLLLFLLLNLLNKVDTNNPTGCWYKWREINKRHISYLKENDQLLRKYICRR